MRADQGVCVEFRIVEDQTGRGLVDVVAARREECRRDVFGAADAVLVADHPADADAEGAGRSAGEGNDAGVVGHGAESSGRPARRVARPLGRVGRSVRWAARPASARCRQFTAEAFQ